MTTTGINYLIASASSDHRIGDTLAEIHGANMRGDVVARDGLIRQLNDLAFAWREAGVPAYTSDDALEAAAKWQANTLLKSLKRTAQSVTDTLATTHGQEEGVDACDEMINLFQDAIREAAELRSLLYKNIIPNQWS